MKKLISICLLFFVFTFSCKAQSQLQQVNSVSNQLIGTWISEDDTNWKIQFNTNGNCYWYYTNEDTEVFSYSISTTSPQCGYEVRVNTADDYYLKLTDSDNEVICYEILGVDSSTLSLSTIGLGVKYFYFNKQQ